LKGVAEWWTSSGRLLDFWCQSRLRWREDDDNAGCRDGDVVPPFDFMVVMLSVSGGFDCLVLPDLCTIQVLYFFPLKQAILYPFHEPFPIFFLINTAYCIFSVPRESNYATSRYRYAKHTSPLVRTVGAMTLVKSKSGGEGCGMGAFWRPEAAQNLPEIAGGTGVFSFVCIRKNITIMDRKYILVSESRIKCATRMKTKRYSTGARNFWRRIVVLYKANPHKDHAPKPPLAESMT
jgi:hypothetical protein